MIVVLPEAFWLYRNHCRTQRNATAFPGEKTRPTANTGWSPRGQFWAASGLLIGPNFGPILQRRNCNAKRERIGDRRNANAEVGLESFPLAHITALRVRNRSQLVRELVEAVVDRVHQLRVDNLDGMRTVVLSSGIDV
jgi:hypothetical protein